MITRFPLEVVYQTGFTVYAVVRGVVAGTRQYWNPTLNTGAGSWEAFNSAHWAQYAIPLTEDTSTGFYAATYPANITGVLTSEAFYIQGGGSPTLGDAPAAGLTRTQGENLGAVGGDANVPGVLQQALLSEQLGVASGTPTTLVIPTTLTNAQLNAFQGRAVIFTSGVAFQCVARIVGYNPTGGVLTLAAPLPIAPVALDTFVIV